jgi:hypothetical protein
LSLDAEKREQVGTDTSLSGVNILGVCDFYTKISLWEYCIWSDLFHLIQNKEKEPEQTWKRSRTVLKRRKSRLDALECCCHIGVEIEIKILILKKRQRARAGIQLLGRNFEVGREQV